MSALPPGWAETTIGSCLPVRYGKAAPKADQGSVPVVASSGTIRHTTQGFAVGRTLVVGRKGGVGRVQMCSGPIWPTDTTYYISVPDGLSDKYLFYQIASLGLERLDRSTAIPSLQRQDLEAAAIRIAPKREQERIVAAIEEQFSRLDAGMLALDRIRQNLKRMRAALLEAAVTGHLVRQAGSTNADELIERIASDRHRDWTRHTSKPYRNPAAPSLLRVSIPGHWRIASLEALTDAIRVICYGILMPKDNIASGISYVRVKDMRNWTIDVAGLHRTSPEIAQKYARASLRPGDLLLAIRGSYGRVAIIPAELNGANITQDSARISAHPDLDRRYLLYYLGGSVANRYYSRVARGVAVKGVNIGDLRTMPVPVPPVEEQVMIADEVERQLAVLDRVETAVAAQLRRSASLRSSIFAAAFSGQLVPHDADDEPARVLLERISAERATSNGHKPTNARKPRTNLSNVLA